MKPLEELSNASTDRGWQQVSKALSRLLLITSILILVLMILQMFQSGFQSVPDGQTALHLRFGQPTNETYGLKPSGSRLWTWPAPIDEVYFFKTSAAQALESKQFGPNTDPLLSPDELFFIVPGRDSALWTRDGDLLHLEARLAFRIDQVQAYFQHVDNASALLTPLFNRALLKATAQFSFNELLGEKQPLWQRFVIQSLNQELAELGTGLRVLDLQISNISLPAAVNAAEMDVYAAAEEARRTIGEARAIASEKQLAATAATRQIIQTGIENGEKLRNQLREDARFLEELRSDRSAVRTKLYHKYTAALRAILRNAGEKVLLDQPEQTDLTLQVKREATQQEGTHE